MIVRLELSLDHCELVGRNYSEAAADVVHYSFPAARERSQNPQTPPHHDTDRQHQSDHASAFAWRLSPASKGGGCLVIPVHRGVSNDIGGATQGGALPDQGYSSAP